MIQAAPDIGVGLKVEDPVTALHRGIDDLGVPDISRHQGESGTPHQTAEELPAARPEAVDDHHFGSRRVQPICEVAADEPCSAGDAGSPDGHGGLCTEPLESPTGVTAESPR